MRVVNSCSSRWALIVGHYAGRARLPERPPRGPVDGASRARDCSNAVRARSASARSASRRPERRRNASTIVRYGAGSQAAAPRAVRGGSRARPRLRASSVTPEPARRPSAPASTGWSRGSRSRRRPPGRTARAPGRGSSGRRRAAARARRELRDAHRRPCARERVRWRGVASTKRSRPIGSCSRSPRSASSASSAASSSPRCRRARAPRSCLRPSAASSCGKRARSAGSSSGSRYGRERRDHADAQRAGERIAVTRARHRADRRPRAARGARAATSSSPAGGEQHAAPIALEQPHAERALELADLRAERGLRDVAALGRAAEAARVGDRDGVLQLPQGEREGTRAFMIATPITAIETMSWSYQAAERHASVARQRTNLLAQHQGDANMLTDWRQVPRLQVCTPS